ncbi:MAG: signal peptidase II [Planctomycetes bacterium]|nr:signal peptidase II [Planctomycetota bacterium]
MKHKISFAIVTAIAAALDLLSKHLVFRNMQSGERIVIIEGFFEFGKTTNPGIVFGLAPSASRVFLWVSILAVPVIIAIFASLKNPRWVTTTSLALILGGTIGNMVDRVGEYKAVRDFITFYYAPGKPWPLFNLADSAICVGVALLSLEMLFFDEKKKKPEEAPAPTEPMPRAEPQVNPDVQTQVQPDAPKPENPPAAS